MPKYRLYIDESGHHSRIEHAKTVPEKYLSLCGIIIGEAIYKDALIPRIESIRSLFYTDPDYKPPLHLEDILNKKNSFIRLRNSKVKEKFDSKLLELYGNVDFQIICIVIDKTRHFDQYVTPEHPYHYCITCMLERYFKFLRNVDSKGDVMAEARGKKEDPLLSQEYRKFYENGTQYIDGNKVQERFSSKDIKIKKKINLIQGLELADLLALPTKLDVLNTYNKISNLNNNFTKKIIEIVQPKYFRGPRGVNGNGKKFI